MPMITMASRAARLAACVGSCSLLMACGSTTSTGDAAPGDGGPPVVSDGGLADTGAAPDSSPISNPRDSGWGGADSSTGGQDSGSDAHGANTSCPPYTEEGDSNFDSSTGLIWRNTLSAPQDWNAATADCMTWGGRLPTENEATSLVQAVESSACASALTWPEPPPTQSFWTSTPDPQNSSFYYGVFFGSAMPIPAPVGDGHWVVCVKGTGTGGDP
jgi:hypothetical protein